VTNNQIKPDEIVFLSKCVKQKTNDRPPTAGNLASAEAGWGQRRWPPWLTDDVISEYARLRHPRNITASLGRHLRHLIHVP